ncbi:glycosyltransferase [Alkalicella caledoniensis]|uniref:Glycosyltransferase n=1 Tax=Alkalicella caledoniensis TaxID=2731377 RepID=A0A7G9W879_ALKCA|nr:glycosyltransferase [Alkalicella caledoniensis]QNO14891.1 glycosyltransferase [Alkalicella caledoniensis]
MLTAVIPARNEAERIERVLNHLLFIGIKNIVIVVNGCHDDTHQIVKNKYPQVKILHFSEPLGIDIPKAIGCSWALQNGASDVLFFDGDMVGEITKELSMLVSTHFENGYDLTLTDCYPAPIERDNIPQRILYPRLHLNQLLSIDNLIGFSSPSHGPHILTRKILQSFDLKDLAVPPVILSHARKNGYQVGIGVSIPEVRLGSKVKNQEHNMQIYDTLWGDCAEAISVYLNLPRNRFFYGHYYDGYNSKRRFDLLDSYLKNTTPYG